MGESEVRSIAHKLDTNALLDQHVKGSIITSYVADDCRKQAKVMGPSDDIIIKCLHDSTYVSLEDCLIIHCNRGKDPFISIWIDERGEDNGYIEVDTRRS